MRVGLLSVALVFYLPLGCGRPTATPVDKRDKEESAVECNAGDLHMANDALNRAAAAYEAKAFEVAYVKARESYALCSQSLASFYLAASLRRLATDSGNNYDPRFAEALCYADEAVADEGQAWLREPALRNEAIDIQKECRKQGAARLYVRAIGTLHVRSGDGRIEHRVKLRGHEPSSVCLMPGNYDIDVGPPTGLYVAKMLPGQDTHISFEKESTGAVASNVLLGFSVAGVALTIFGVASREAQYSQTSLCESATMNKRICANIDELRTQEDTFDKLFKAGLILFGLTSAAGVILSFTEPKDHQIPHLDLRPPPVKLPKKSEGLKSVACRWGATGFSCGATF